MTVQIINIGSSETSGDGESIRSAFNKINDNFASFRNGYSGSQGPIGYDGSQGDTGYVGSASTEVGYTGSQGNDGLQGITGFTGSQGTIGFTGSRGSTGFTGSNGSVGFTGSIGPQGYTGDMGDQGATGYTGSHGSSGFTGSQGTTGYVGSHGSTGYTGSKGDIGNTGNIGYTGSTGYVGSNGDLGFTGSHGYTGSKGDVGYGGSSGTNGYTGSKGDTGYIGSHGYTGSKGDVGYAGSSGTNGYTGSKGDTGYIGSHGYTGSIGIGYTGSSGTTGFTGSTGPASTVGNLNYVQNSQASNTSMPSNASFPFTVISAPAITTNGNPVQVIVTGDANPLANSAWCQMRLYRDSTAIGQIVQAESTYANINVPYSIQFVDAVAAGTYTYSMKVTAAAAAGFNFGEATGPVITVTELQNVIGATGYTGSAGTNGYNGSAGVLTGAIPAWTSAGAITITATTTNPTKGATRTQDNISYRQIGAKEWEIVLTYIQTASTGGNSGSGDYLITLPNSLSFDTTLPSQQIYTGNIGTSTWAHNPYVIPNGNGTITNLNVGGNIFPMVYNATKFRILTLTYGSGIQCWGSGYYSVGGDNPRIQLSFRFTST
jgi:hypothetical protein